MKIHAVSVTLVAAIARSASATCTTGTMGIYNKTTDLVSDMRKEYEDICKSSFCTTSNKPFSQVQVQNFTNFSTATPAEATMSSQCTDAGFNVCKAQMEYKVSTSNPFVEDAIVELTIKEIDKTVCVPPSCTSVDQAFTDLRLYTNPACVVANGQQCDFVSQSLDCEDTLGTNTGGGCADDLPGRFSQLMIAKGVMVASMNLYCTQATVPGQSANAYCGTKTVNGKIKQNFDFENFVAKNSESYKQLNAACGINNGQMCYVDFELDNTPAVNDRPGLLDQTFKYQNYPVCMSTPQCNTDTYDGDLEEAITALVLDQMTGNIGLDTSGIVFPELPGNIEIPELPGNIELPGNVAVPELPGNIDATDLSMPGAVADKCDLNSKYCDIKIINFSCEEIETVTASPTVRTTPPPSAAPKSNGGNGSNTDSGAGNSNGDVNGGGGGDTGDNAGGDAGGGKDGTTDGDKDNVENVLKDATSAATHTTRMIKNSLTFVSLMLGALL